MRRRLFKGESLMKKFEFTMEKITQIFKYTLYGFSGALVLGLLFIIIGASASVLGLLIVGIMFFIGSIAAIGFIFYLSFEHNRLLKVYKIILQEKDVSIKEIASKLGKAESEIRSEVSECFTRGYLKGYTRVGERVCLLEILEEEQDNSSEEMASIKCASCGASFSYNKKDLPQCPYCGAYAESK